MTEHPSTEVSGQGSTAASPGRDDEDVLHADGHEDDEGHGGHGSALGPLDPAAWGLSALGVLLGLVVAAGFLLATGCVAV